MVASELCRNGRHPIEQRRRNGAGKWQCGPCRLERHKARTRSKPVDADVLRDPEREARFEAWSAGLDDAIAEARRREGFDGRERTWRTLGDVVGMQREAHGTGQVRVGPEHPDYVSEPVVRHTWRTRPIVACPDCGAGRFEGRPCRHCEPRSARFQALAALDVGRLFDPDILRGATSGG